MRVRNEARLDGPRPLGEEQCRVRARHRGHRKHTLRAKTQPFPARAHHDQLRTSLDQLNHQSCDRIEQVLAVVDYEKRPLGRQRRNHRLGDRSIRLFGDLEGLRERRRQQ